LTVVNTDVLGRIDFQAPLEADGADGDARLISASIEAVAQDTFSDTVNSTDLIFKTGHSETATEKFRITSQGELGVGGANYGTDGQVLTSTGAGTAPAWEDAGGGGGLVEYDIWTLSSNATNPSGVLNTNMIRFNGQHDSESIFEKIGTGMTKHDGSGALAAGTFSFPSTGKWEVNLWFICSNSGASTAHQWCSIKHVVNGAANDVADCSVYGSYIVSSECSIMLDIRDVNDGIQFYISNISGTLYGTANSAQTGLSFKKMGDT